MINVSLSGYTIYMRLFSMKECDAIRPGLNCFISMIISVDTLCGFAPSGTQNLIPTEPDQAQPPWVLLPTGSDGRGVFGFGSIPVAILPSNCQDTTTCALYLHKHDYS